MIKEEINIIQVLEDEKIILRKKLTDINILIDTYRYRGLEQVTMDIIMEYPYKGIMNKLGDANYVPRNAFPMEGTIDDQIFFLLEKDSVIKKRADIEIEILEAIGEQVCLREQLRRLFRDRKLIQVKYNKSNKLNYYGLIDWVVDNGEEKMELIPSYEPYGLKSKGWIGEVVKS